MFDMDKSGVLSREDLHLAFSKFGRSISDEEIDDIMRQFDKDHSESLDFAEFMQLI